MTNLGTLGGESLDSTTPAPANTSSTMPVFAHISGSAGVRDALKACSIDPKDYLLTLCRNSSLLPSRPLLQTLYWRTTWDIPARGRTDTKGLINIAPKKERELDAYLTHTQTLRSNLDLENILQAEKARIEVALEETFSIRSIPGLEYETLLTEGLEAIWQDTLLLRATPTKYCCLGRVAEIDIAAFEHIITNLLCDTSLVKHFQPSVVAAITEELCEARWIDDSAAHFYDGNLEKLKTIVTSQKINLPIDFVSCSPKPIQAVSRNPALLAARRGITLPQLDGFASVAPRCDCRFAETLLFYKVVEDPDFPFDLQLDPSKAAWGPGYIRSDVDVPEGSDFFTQTFLIEKVRIEFNREGKFPTSSQIYSMRIAALKTFDEMWKAEVVQAVVEDMERVLRCMIEHNIDKIVATEREGKALRKISLQSLIAAGMTKLSYADSEQIQALLKVKMEEVLVGEKHVELEERFVSDIISIYSDDIGIEYWARPSTMEVVMNDKRRKKILDWIPTPSATIHTALAHGDPLEEIKDNLDDIYADFLGKELHRPLPPELANSDNDFYRITWPKAAAGDTMLDWSVFFGEVEPEKTEEDEELPEREEGFYSNMSGLSDVSIGTNSSGSGSENTDNDEDEGDEESPDTSDYDDFGSTLELVGHDEVWEQIRPWDRSICVMAN